MKKQILIAFFLLLGLVAVVRAAGQDLVFVEAESFRDTGGWVNDTQFVHIMGSPYLMAHGMGVPVKDAVTSVKFPSTGSYKVFVRTKDWVARWKAPGQPGKFQLLVDGKAVDATFGTQGADWFWQAGGNVEITKAEVEIALHDLTGFNGRCDAIVFAKDAGFIPPADAPALAAFRKTALGLPEKPVDAGEYDLVVVGGGYGGLGSAIAGARMGCKVAFIQDRPVLGGNGSSEIRVWSQGGTTLGKYPKIGEIVEEFADAAKASPGLAEEFKDEKKELIVLAEKNIKLFLNTQAYGVEKKGDQIAAVLARDVKTGKELRFGAKLVADCTGHAFVGALAGAEFEMAEQGHMGMSNMWRWSMADAPQAFPQTPWALDLAMADFPYPGKFKAEWFWEGGFNRHPINDLEYIRDWNFRAVFGAFNAMKNKDGKEKHVNAKMDWVAYIGGPRESRRLKGDLKLSREDIKGKVEFPDSFVPSTWSIDLHEPKEQFAKKFPEDPFISKAIFDHSVDKKNGYLIPYRCFYSKNVTNLFMAGRNISVDRDALGTIRVMRTIGMMGEVVGKAASICVKHNCLPRAVYANHLEELKELVNLPGNARRETVTSPIDANAPLPSPASKEKVSSKRGGVGGGSGVDPKKLPGIVIDDEAAKFTGKWATGQGLPGYIGKHYSYAPGGKDDHSARFEIKVPQAGTYEVRFRYSAHENRANNSPVTIISADGEKTIEVNQQVPGALANEFVSLGTYRFDPAKAGAVVVGTKGTKGNVSVDAVQVLPAK